MAKLKVFLSYRRDDLHGVAQGIVGRIYDRLEDHYGNGNVFMDIDNIPPGVNFVEYLDSWVGRAEVVLAVIGPQWAEILESRRSDPRDFVRIELESALARGIPVVPLLLRGARMPGADVLTGGLARLAEHQAFVVDDGRDFKQHLGRLIRDLDTHYAGRKEPQPPKAKPKPATPPPPPKPERKPAEPRRTGHLWGIAVIGALLTLAFLWPKNPPPEPSTKNEAPRTLPPAPPTPVGKAQPITKNEEPITASFTNSLSMKFVPIPGTSILMSIWETRVQDYAAYAAANAGVNDEWKDVEFGGVKQEPDHPVVNVSWEDAQAFCQWLSKKEGKTYRLPTDHEWSVAVGIGDREDPEASPSDKNRKIKDVYPWGTQWPPPLGAGNYSGQESASSYKIDKYRDSHPFTAPVGSYTPNPLGIYDFGGNAYEWCGDAYSPSSRVLRGASWGGLDSEFLLSSHRINSDPAIRYNNLGFRCVVVVGER